MDLEVIIPLVAGTVLAALLIAKRWVQATPSTKDDEVFEKVESIVRPIASAFDKSEGPESDSSDKPSS